MDGQNFPEKIEKEQEFIRQVNTQEESKRIF